VRQAMQQGALGVASSLSGPPGSWIDTDTLVAMGKIAGEYGGTCARNRGFLAGGRNLCEGARRVDVPLPSGG
jgi:hypothetical protein